MAGVIRTLRHPGPVLSPRWTALHCTATPVALTLPAADSLLASVAAALADFDGAWLWIEGAAMARLDFLIPGSDPAGAHAAWYAGPHRMPPGARILRLGLHLGWREGARFLHGHGVFAAPGWTGPQAGHILPRESALAWPVRATGFGIRGARLVQRPDPETGFPLFVPEDCGGGEGALLMTARPNQDLGTAVAAAAGGLDLEVHGLGSLVAPCFTCGQRIDSPATEILLTRGRVAAGVPTFSADVVGMDGVLHEGVLAAGAAGICVTAEMLLCRVP
jgi:hypothetical protein